MQNQVPHYGVIPNKMTIECHLHFPNVIGDAVFMNEKQNGTSAELFYWVVKMVA